MKGGVETGSVGEEVSGWKEKNIGPESDRKDIITQRAQRATKGRTLQKQASSEKAFLLRWTGRR